MSTLLDIKNLEVYYGGIHAIRNLSMHIEEGEIVSIIGANGAGKSTLLRTIAGDKKFDSGDIRFHGDPLPKAVHEVVD